MRNPWADPWGHKTHTKLAVLLIAGLASIVPAQSATRISVRGSLAYT
jgi:hypothetical protein